MSVQEFDGSYEDVVDQIRWYPHSSLGHPYERIVFTNGCFDLLHLGHLHVLEYCRRLAGPKGAVVVGLNSDDSVRRLKGLLRPVMNEFERGTLLSSLKTVDHVIIFEEDTPIRLIEALKPEIIVKGGDYDVEDVVGRNISSVMICPRSSEVSTTDIIKRIQNGQA